MFILNAQAYRLSREPSTNQRNISLDKLMKLQLVFNTYQMLAIVFDTQELAQVFLVILYRNFMNINLRVVNVLTPPNKKVVP